MYDTSLLDPLPYNNEPSLDGDSSHLEYYRYMIKRKQVREWFGRCLSYEEYQEIECKPVSNTVKIEPPYLKDPLDLSSYRHDPLDGIDLEKYWDRKDLSHKQQNAIKRKVLFDQKRYVCRELTSHHASNPSLNPEHFYAADRYPTCSCKYNVQPFKDEVNFYQNNKGIVSTPDLISCQKYWVCPVCSVVHRQRKNKRLHLMSHNNKELDGSQHLMTLAIPHHAGLKLQQVADEIKAVRKYFTNSKPLDAAKKRFGVRDLAWFSEIDLSIEKGWHVHFHVIVFSEKGWDVDGWNEWARARWGKGVESVIGYVASDDAYDLEESFKALPYVAKQPSYFTLLPDCNKDEWAHHRVVELAELRGFRYAYFGRNKWTKKLNEPVPCDDEDDFLSNHVLSMTKGMYKEVAYRLDSFLACIEGVEFPKHSDVLESDSIDQNTTQTDVIGKIHTALLMCMLSDNRFVLVVLGYWVDWVDWKMLWVMRRRIEPPNHDKCNVLSDL